MQLNAFVFFFFFTEWKRHNLKFISWSLRIDEPTWGHKGFSQQAVSAHHAGQNPPRESLCRDVHHVKRQNRFRNEHNSEGRSFLC